MLRVVVLTIHLVDFDQSVWIYVFIDKCLWFLTRGVKNSLLSYSNLCLLLHIFNANKYGKQVKLFN